MITTAIIQLAYSLISWLINIFPASTGFPAAATTAFSSLGGYIGVWDPILPIATLATCVSLVFALEIGIFGFKTLKWIFSHIPYIGGKGH